MGRRGPPPKPTRLKLITGNPGKRALNRQEPEPAMAVPECPGHLSVLAREEWARITVELAAIGLLSRLDRAALAAYCQAWGRWVGAEKRIAKRGLTHTTPKGVLMPSPYLGIANRAMKQMKEFLTEFGLTPSSRTRIAMDVKVRPADPADAFFSTGHL